MYRRSRRDPEAIAFARDQRARANEFAQDVWQTLRNRRCRNQKFRREYPIPPYTVDFCCVALTLVFEFDVEHHQTAEGRSYDQRRDPYLAEQGYQVVRVPDYEVLLDATAVLRRIEEAIDERTKQARPHPSPSPTGECEWCSHSPVGEGAARMK